jgi:hypothetical protein
MAATVVALERSEHRRTCTVGYDQTAGRHTVPHQMHTRLTCADHTRVCGHCGSIEWYYRL